MEKKEVTKRILYGIAVAGVISIALVAPGALVPLAKIFQAKKESRGDERRKIAKALAYLKKNRLIILKEQGNTLTVELTEKGTRRVKQYQLDDLRIEKPARWDKKWRIVLFDIPEKKKWVREALRQKLRLLGFVQIQKSAWACPWPCENEIQLLAEFFGVTPYVQIVLAEKISNDVKLKANFNLLS